MRSVKKNTFSNSTALKGLGGWLLGKGEGVRISVRANLVSVVQPYASPRRED